MQFKLAGDPSTVAEISQALGALDASGVTVQSDTTHRDFSVVEVLITAVIGSAVKVAFEQVVVAIKAALAERKSMEKLVVSVGGAPIELRRPEDIDKLRAALDAT